MDDPLTPTEWGMALTEEGFKEVLRTHKTHIAGRPTAVGRLAATVRLHKTRAEDARRRHHQTEEALMTLEDVVIAFVKEVGRQPMELPPNVYKAFGELCSKADAGLDHYPRRKEEKDA